MKGYKMVRAIMAEYRLGEKDFFGSKRQEHVNARIDAMRRLKAAGLNKAEIARVTRRNYDTVRYWLSPKLRLQKLSRNPAQRRRKTSPIELRSASLIRPTNAVEHHA